MGSSRTYAVPLTLAPGLKLTLRVRNKSAKPDVGTVVRHGGDKDDLVFVTGHPSMRESDPRWSYRKIVRVDDQWVLSKEEYSHQPPAGRPYRGTT